MNYIKNEYLQKVAKEVDTSKTSYGIIQVVWQGRIILGRNWQNRFKKCKNFVKGMFCDENGFSFKRTFTTLGTAAAFAAIAAIPGVGPAIALTGGAALGTYTA